MDSTEPIRLLGHLESDQVYGFWLIAPRTILIRAFNWRGLPCNISVAWQHHRTVRASPVKHQTRPSNVPAFHATCICSKLEFHELKSTSPALVSSVLRTQRELNITCGMLK